MTTTLPPQQVFLSPQLTHAQRRGSVFFDLPQTYSRIFSCFPIQAPIPVAKPTWDSIRRVLPQSAPRGFTKNTRRSVDSSRLVLTVNMTADAWKNAVYATLEASRYGGAQELSGVTQYRNNRRQKVPAALDAGCENERYFALHTNDFALSSRPRSQCRSHSAARHTRPQANPLHPTASARCLPPAACCAPPARTGHTIPSAPEQKAAP